MVTIDARGSKWIVLGLLASLAINLFLGGLVIGRMINAGGPRARAAAGELAERLAAGGQGAALNGPMQRMAQSIPDAHRATFLRAIESHRAALQATSQGLRDARLKLNEATVAEPFNRASFLVAADQLAIKTQAQRKAFVDALVDGIANLPPEVRRNIVDSERGGTSGRRRSQ